MFSPSLAKEQQMELRLATTAEGDTAQDRDKRRPGECKTIARGRFRTFQIPATTACNAGGWRERLVALKPAPSTPATEQSATSWDNGKRTVLIKSNSRPDE
jgi:hypothetical protein